MARRPPIAFTTRVANEVSKRGPTPPALVWAFALVSAVFLASTIYSDVQGQAIDAGAGDIQLDAVPSLERLTDARTALRHLEIASTQLSEEVGGREVAHMAMDRAHADLDHALMGYLAIPLEYPGEREGADALNRAVAGMDADLVRLHELANAGKSEAAQRFADGEVRADVDQVDAALGRLLDLNAQGARSAAIRIARVRQHTTWIALGLDGLSVLVAVAAAWVARRAVRRQAELERAHAELLERRAEDLELFAKRVAHDLLSPLSALSFSLAMVKRGVDKGQPVAEPIGRATACLKRAQRLVDGVFDFARAGASSPSRGTADLRETVDGVLDEVRADEAQTAALVVEPFDDVRLACSPGVLTSVLSNLVRNALKYMGARPDPRVTLRARRDGARVRVEVEDTGPGLPPGLEEHMFEPYVRGPEAETPGLGLGLSTVRRFVEGHGGQVGVRSVAGKGCVFWFDLPAAGPEGDIRHHTPARSA